MLRNESEDDKLGPFLKVPKRSNVKADDVSRLNELRVESCNVLLSLLVLAATLGLVILVLFSVDWSLSSIRTLAASFNLTCDRELCDIDCDVHDTELSFHTAYKFLTATMCSCFFVVILDGRSRKLLREIDFIHATRWVLVLVSVLCLTTVYILQFPLRHVTPTNPPVTYCDVVVLADYANVLIVDTLSWFGACISLVILVVIEVAIKDNFLLTLAVSVFKSRRGTILSTTVVVIGTGLTLISMFS